MPQDNGFSPLFSDASSWSQPPQQPSQAPSWDPIQTAKTSENIFGTLDGKEIKKEQTPPVTNSHLSTKEPEKKESTDVKTETSLPNVTEKVQSAQWLSSSSKPTADSSVPPKESAIPAEKVKENIAPLLQKTISSALPQQTSSEGVGVSEILGNTTSKPIETIPQEKTSESQQKQMNISDKADPVLASYLQADRVYQAMLRLENHEKIRFRLAVRYLLLMFAFFLVFAWIVNNRIIMFGFSEFVWLARIRDGLFASIAGLFALTIWFWSVTWTRNVILVSLMRMIGIIFFLAIIIAFYFS